MCFIPAYCSPSCTQQFCSLNSTSPFYHRDQSLLITGMLFIATCYSSSPFRLCLLQLVTTLLPPPYQSLQVAGKALSTYYSGIHCCDLMDVERETSFREHPHLQGPAQNLTVLQRWLAPSGSAHEYGGEGGCGTTEWCAWYCRHIHCCSHAYSAPCTHRFYFWQIDTD